MIEDPIDEAPPPRLSRELVRNAPALARVAAGLSWRAARWGLAAYAGVGAQMARAAADPELALQIATELGHDLREYARALLGISELEARVTQLLPPPARNGNSGNGDVPGADAAALRRQGASLLRAAARIEPFEHAHPAYARILTELAPDEGRILRLLATEGAQPAVDVRSGHLIGVGSEIVAPGLSMIGAEAGVQHRARVPAYLNNLERLGLIWFSREPIGNTSAYQVLEAQPDVLDAMHRASRCKTVQRSIQLTPFGTDFCEVCLPLQTAEAEALSDPE
jgi:hypothetical protein